jgi:hypothetical protein
MRHSLANLVDVPGGETINPELKKQFGLLQRSERLLEAVPDFTEARASSFPLCPRAYHISRRLPAKLRPGKREAFMSEAATLMGTALHLVAQKWFALQFSTSWYGNWHCYHCDRTIYNRVGMQRCKKCKREMVYEEYAIKRQKGVPWSGHIDGLLKNFGGVNYLIDFKGSYQSKMGKVRGDNKPFESHYCQTNAYAHAINAGLVDVGDFGKISKILIIYIERGRPHILWEPIQVSLSRSVYRQTMTFIKSARRSVKQMVIPKGFCYDSSDYYATYCPWKNVCFSSKLDHQLSDTALPELKFKTRREDMLSLLLHAGAL